MNDGEKVDIIKYLGKRKRNVEVVYVAEIKILDFRVAITKINELKSELWNSSIETIRDGFRHKVALNTMATVL